MTTHQQLESILNDASSGLATVDCRHPAFRYFRSIQQTAKAEIARLKAQAVEPAPEPAPKYRRLKLGETIRHDDELQGAYLEGDPIRGLQGPLSSSSNNYGGWIGVTVSAGLEVEPLDDNNNWLVFRRKI